MSLDILKELLLSFNWEYRITYEDKVYCSPKYFELSKKNISENVFKYKNKYYIRKEKIIKIGKSNCKIEYLEDITNNFGKILALKKDKLTGLATRENLEDYIYKLKRISTFVLCDLDDFKKVNDNYGHPVGDQILKMLGSIIISNIRKKDFAGRYGGEEFLIIFDTNDVEMVKKRIDKINRIFNSKSKNLNLSFSAGISIYDKSKTIAQTIKEVDIALYYVKQHGKNNSIIYNKKLEKKGID